MTETDVVRSLAALAQEVRLRVFRALVVAGQDGLTPGVILEQLGMTPALLSFHLKELERSGLIAQRRESRSIVYSASYDALADLVKFLMEDCCAGHPMIREGVQRPDGCCKTDAARSEGDIVA